jgi:hypothetical protein
METRGEDFSSIQAVAKELDFWTDGGVKLGGVVLRNE